MIDKERCRKSNIYPKNCIASQKDYKGYIATKVKNKITNECWYCLEFKCSLSDKQINEVKQRSIGYNNCRGYKNGILYSMTDNFDRVINDTGVIPHWKKGLYYLLKISPTVELQEEFFEDREYENYSYLKEFFRSIFWIKD